MAGTRIAALTSPSKRVSLTRALGILGVHNLVQNTLLNERGYVSGNIVVSAALVCVARRSGLSWDAIGLVTPRRGSTTRAGVIAVLASASGALTALVNPEFRAVIADDQGRVSDRSHIVRRALIRFPVGTALFEEVAFRGVLPVLASSNESRGDVVSAAVFAVWHLFPTARLQSRVATAHGRPTHGRVRAALVGSAAAGVAGLGLSWLRRSTDSLFAPWLVHSAVNATAFVAAAIRARA